MTRHIKLSDSAYRSALRCLAADCWKECRDSTTLTDADDFADYVLAEGYYAGAVTETERSQ